MVDTLDPTLQAMETTRLAQSSQKQASTRQDKASLRRGHEAQQPNFSRAKYTHSAKPDDVPANDPNRQVRDASHTVRIAGHPCKSGTCQKKGYANCRCKEKDNEQMFFAIITYLILQLRAVHWQLFHTPPRWVEHPHSHRFHFTDADSEEAIAAECEPMDVVFMDDDHELTFELTDDPFLMILRAIVPLQVLSREFEVFLKQLAAEMPGVQSVQQLYQAGYQLRHDPENGLSVLRMPKPEHQLMFLQHCCRQGLINMLESQLVEQFARGMQARYGNTLPRLVPTPKGGHRRKDREEELELANRYPNPLKMQCRLDPKK